MNRPPKKTTRVPNMGFSLIEALVTLLVVNIAFLGMAALMINVTKVRSKQKQFDQAVKLSKAKMGDLEHVTYSLLATGTTSEEKEEWGEANETVVGSGPYNGKGEEDTGATGPPFIFMRSFVVCLDDADGGLNAASQGGDSCGNVLTTRPDELSCDTTKTIAAQAMIRILTTFRDRNGKCHTAPLEQIVIDLS